MSDTSTAGVSAKIGIFSGTFDPVHGGHIAFALEAIKSAGLDMIYFIPEQKPRRKEGVTHYAHRIAMLKLALKPYKNIRLLELPDKQFSSSRTLPRIKRLLPDAELHMLGGSDVLDYLYTEQWPDSQQLLDAVKLVVGVRSGLKLQQAKDKMSLIQPDGYVMQSMRPHASSRDIRGALHKGQDHHELLGSLKTYIKSNWLYCSVPANNS